MMYQELGVTLMKGEPMMKEDETRETREQAEFAIVQMLMEGWYATPGGCRLKSKQILAWLEEAGWRAPKREEKSTTPR